MSGDSIQLADIAHWDLTKVVRPEFASSVYGILNDPDLYDHIQPFPGALEAVELLRRNGHRVVFASSCIRGSYDAKAECLVRHGFLPDTKFLKDFYGASDKSLIRADVLVDDGVHNLETFKRWKILVTRPHNAALTVKAPHWRVNNLMEAARKIQHLSRVVEYEHT